MRCLTGLGLKGVTALAHGPPCRHACKCRSLRRVLLLMSTHTRAPQCALLDGHAATLHRNLLLRGTALPRAVAVLLPPPGGAESGSREASSAALVVAADCAFEEMSVWGCLLAKVSEALCREASALSLCGGAPRACGGGNARFAPCLLCFSRVARRGNLCGSASEPTRHHCASFVASHAHRSCLGHRRLRANPHQCQSSSQRSDAALKPFHVAMPMRSATSKKMKAEAPGSSSERAEREEEEVRQTARDVRQ